jgi:Fe-S-cluster containining protein
VPDLSWCDLPEWAVEVDRDLVAGFDAALADGAARAGTHLACRVGCTPCCVGPFDITVLDAARLRRGLAALASRDPDAADRVAAAARVQWREMAADFPGDAATALLGADEEARAAFLGANGRLRCPALDAVGACGLYSARPLSCRSYGVPASLGEHRLEPCPRNFVGATAEEVAEAEVAFDPGDMEGELLTRLAAAGLQPGETIVAAVLTEIPSPRSR